MNSIDYDPNLSKQKGKTNEVKRKLHHGVTGKLYVFTCRCIPLNLTRRHTNYCLRVNNIAMNLTRLHTTYCLRVNNIAK